MSRAEPLTGARIAEGDPAFALEPVERLLVGGVIAVMMGDRDDDLLARVVAAGEGRLAVLDLQRHVAADEVEAGIAHQRARAAGRASVRIWKPLQTPSTNDAALGGLA